MSSTTKVTTSDNQETSKSAEYADAELKNGAQVGDYLALDTAEVSVDKLAEIASERATPALGTAVTLEGISQAQAAAALAAEKPLGAEAAQEVHLSDTERGGMVSQHVIIMRMTGLVRLSKGDIEV